MASSRWGSISGVGVGIGVAEGIGVGVGVGWGVAVDSAVGSSVALGVAVESGTRSQAARRRAVNIIETNKYIVSRTQQYCVHSGLQLPIGS